MNLEPYALAVDLILIVVFVLTVYRSWKRGFVGAVAGLLSVIGAVIAARLFGFVLNGYLQRQIFDSLTADFIRSVITDAVNGVSGTTDTVTAALSSALDSIRSYTDVIGIPINMDLSAFANLSFGEISSDAVDALTQQIAQPIAEVLSEWAAYLILFAVAYLILRIAFRIIDLVMRLPILHEANSFLGAVCGFLLGAGYAFIAARVLSLGLGILVTRGVLPPEVMTGTIFSLLCGHSSL